ncbi:MAG: hypothetical protein J4428_05260 [Candidatus Aenigmarchaeota archaeon]|nr:hypothetical protein [Candidatus Aenigmarchaeota archaeon]
MRKGHLLLAIGVLLLISFGVKADTVSTPLNQFNISTDLITLNWVNNYQTNLTVLSNSTNQELMVEILNNTAIVAANYSQSNTLTLCTSGEDAAKYHISVKNATGSLSNIFSVAPNASVPESNITIMDNIDFIHLQCNPGKYYLGTLTFRNRTQTNETLNASVTIHIPISDNNTLSSSTGIGSFGGTLPANSSTTQSYYFNTNNITNATGISINLSGWSASQDLDVFLIGDDSRLKAKSVNKTHNNEQLIYNFLPSSSAYWEIRIFGNSTSAISYSGSISYSTLNSSSYLIDFGNINATNTTQQAFTLRNVGNITINNADESKEFYLVKRFENNTSNNFTFLVPDSSIASKLKATLNWTGLGNYSINLFTPNGTILLSSFNRDRFGHIAAVEQEIYNETTAIEKGIWKLQVRNMTNDTTETYTATVYMYVNASQWIATNYTTMTFNKTNLDNFTKTVGANFTVPNNTLDGSYEGFLIYGATKLRIPVKSDVRTGLLVVNNTINSTIISLDENLYGNVTRVLNITLNNTGRFDLPLATTNSSNAIKLTTNSSNYINFTYDALPTTLSANSNHTLNITFPINTSLTENKAGVYEGWLYFNATDSHPYGGFNLTLKINLTDLLRVDVLDMLSVDGNNVVENNTINETMKAVFNVYYINGTRIDTINETNVTSVFLTENNITSQRIPSSGSLIKSKGSEPVNIGGNYSINSTIQDNRVGGRYRAFVVVNFTRDDSRTFNGQGSFSPFSINNTGLYMRSNITGCSFSDDSCSGGISIGNSSTAKLHVNVTNYGLSINSSANINVTENCGGYSVSNPSYSNCPSTSFVPTPGSSICIATFTITAGSTAASSCTLTVNGTPSNMWYNPAGVTVAVTVTAPSSSSSSSTSSSGGAGATTTETLLTAEQEQTTPEGEPAVYLEFTSYASIISITQGQNRTESIMVSNINDTEWQDVKLEISGIENWYAITPSNKMQIDPLSNHTYTVKFSIPENASVKDYYGKFVAKSDFATVNTDFTLRILPGSQVQSGVNITLDLLKIKISDLEKQIEDLKDKGRNTTEVEAKLTELKSRYAQAVDYNNKGDARSAYDLIDDVEKLASDTSELINTSFPPKKTSTLGKIVKWAIIAVAIGGVIILGYLLWPSSEGFKTEKGFTPKGPKEETKNKIKDEFEKLKQRWKNLREKK